MISKDPDVAAAGKAPQDIYYRALDEPAIGYADSSKFAKTVYQCPKCKSILYMRIRRGSQSPLGLVCPKQCYRHTFPTTEGVPAALKQLESPLIIDAIEPPPKPPKKGPAG